MTPPKSSITLQINGEEKRIETDPCRRLLDVLRDDFDLCGTKEGCGLGECGACTVLLDGEPVNSCLVLVGAVDGRAIVTIEGLGGLDGALHPVQKAFVEAGAVQCGFCTPGLVMNASAFVEKHDFAPPEAIRKHIAGNLCRCTGYTKIIEAVTLALQWKREAAAKENAHAEEDER
jgi:carbon-monoxide dehydrogenase small subunit